MTADPMTKDELNDFVRTYLADHPAADTHDVFAAIRAAGYSGLLQTFVVHDACVAVRPLLMLSTVDEATAVLARLADKYDDLGVFWDRGWGDDGQVAEISIVANSNGQAPLAYLTPEVYAELVTRRIVGPNCYLGYKARRFHDVQVQAVAR